MVMRVLLIGRTHDVLDGAMTALNIPDLELEAATNAGEAAQALRRASFSHVFMGGGIDLDERVKIVRSVFGASDKTTVHLKDVASGPEGFLPFVGAILTAFRAQQNEQGTVANR